MIDNKVNRNISVSNGKVIDDGSKTMVMGICLPGMQESLGVSTSKFKVPNSVEISMDTSDFELGNVITFATPKIIEENDLEFFDKLDELYDS